MARHALIHRDRHPDDEHGEHEHAHGRHWRHSEDTQQTAQREALPTDRHTDHEAAHDHFGGINWGACFFGWLVAVGVMVILAGIASAIATAAGDNLDLTRTEAEANAESIGIGVAVALAVIMFLGYFAGGYVAGRMSRFDGGRQGIGVWVVALVAMLLAAGTGALFGSQYNVLERIELPSIGLSADQLGWGVAVTAVVLLAVMLLGAVLGGKVGHRYHDRVDAAVGYR